MTPPARRTPVTLPTPEELAAMCEESNRRIKATIEAGLCDPDTGPIEDYSAESEGD
jgi:hypothetical protein